MTQLTELIVTAIETVPETVAPLDGDVMVTLPAVGVGVGVGVDLFFTRIILEEVPINRLAESYAFAETVCMPLTAPVDNHEIVPGVDAR